MVSALLKPPEALQLALGQYQIDLTDRMGIFPNVLDHRNANACERSAEVYLVNHTLDIGHTDLEGMMLVALGKRFVYLLRKLLRDKSLAIKQRDLDI